MGSNDFELDEHLTPPSGIDRFPSKHSKWKRLQLAHAKLLAELRGLDFGSLDDRPRALKIRDKIKGIHDVLTSLGSKIKRKVLDMSFNDRGQGGADGDDGGDPGDFRAEMHGVLREIGSKYTDYPQSASNVPMAVGAFFKEGVVTGDQIRVQVSTVIPRGDGRNGDDAGDAVEVGCESVVISTHPDGSTKHASVGIKVPSITENKIMNITFGPGIPAATSDFDTSNIPSAQGFEQSVYITALNESFHETSPFENGHSWQAKITPAEAVTIRNAILSGSSNCDDYHWVNAPGKFIREYIHPADLIDETTGQTHPWARIVFQFKAFSGYGIRVAVAVENGYTATKQEVDADNLLKGLQFGDIIFENIEFWKEGDKLTGTLVKQIDANGLPNDRKPCRVLDRTGFRYVYEVGPRVPLTSYRGSYQYLSMQMKVAMPFDHTRPCTDLDQLDYTSGYLNNSAGEYDGYYPVEFPWGVPLYSGANRKNQNGTGSHTSIGSLPGWEVLAFNSGSLGMTADAWHLLEACDSGLFGYRRFTERVRPEDTAPEILSNPDLIGYPGLQWDMPGLSNNNVEKFRNKDPKSNLELDIEHLSLHAFCNYISNPDFRNFETLAGCCAFPMVEQQRKGGGPQPGVILKTGRYWGWFARHLIVGVYWLPDGNVMRPYHLEELEDSIDDIQQLRTSLPAVPGTPSYVSGGRPYFASLLNLSIWATSWMVWSLQFAYKCLSDQLSNELAKETFNEWAAFYIYSVVDPQERPDIHQYSWEYTDARGKTAVWDPDRLWDYNVQVGGWNPNRVVSSGKVADNTDNINDWPGDYPGATQYKVGDYGELQYRNVQGAGNLLRTSDCRKYRNGVEYQGKFAHAGMASLSFQHWPNEIVGVPNAYQAGLEYTQSGGLDSESPGHILRHSIEVHFDALIDGTVYFKGKLFDDGDGELYYPEDPDEPLANPVSSNVHYTASHRSGGGASGDNPQLSFEMPSNWQVDNVEIILQHWSGWPCYRESIGSGISERNGSTMNTFLSPLLESESTSPGEVSFLCTALAPDYDPSWTDRWATPCTIRGKYNSGGKVYYFTTINGIVGDFEKNSPIWEIYGVDVDEGYFDFECRRGFIKSKANGEIKDIQVQFGIMNEVHPSNSYTHVPVLIDFDWENDDPANFSLKDKGKNDFQVYGGGEVGAAIGESRGQTLGSGLFWEYILDWQENKGEGDRIRGFRYLGDDLGI